MAVTQTLVVKALDDQEAIETAIAEATARKPFDSIAKPTEFGTWQARTGKFKTVAWIVDQRGEWFDVVVEVEL